MTLPRGIFLNVPAGACSIFESGRMFFAALKPSSRYALDYAEVRRFDDVPRGYDFYVFNYHHVAMASLDTVRVRDLPGCKLTFVLEMLPDDPFVLCPDHFDAYCVPDPTLRSSNPRVFPFPRPLERALSPALPPEDGVPVFGSFGFGTPGNGFEDVVRAVNREFDRATVRLKIPSASRVDSSAKKAHELAELCRTIAKPGIEVVVDHGYLSGQELISWCGKSTLNVFLYDRHQPGLSATTDQAIASGRPLAVSECGTFRHIHAYMAPYPELSLWAAIAQTSPAVAQMQRDWAADNFRRRFEEVLAHKSVLAKLTVSPIMAPGVSTRSPAEPARSHAAKASSSSPSAMPLRSSPVGSARPGGLRKTRPRPATVPAEYGIAVFHNLGEILTCTPIARQLKASEPGCRITWFTSERGACVLDNNPYVDEVVRLLGEPSELDSEISRLEKRRPWKRFLTATCFHSDDLARGPFFDLVRAGAKLDWFVPLTFTLRLSDAEVRQARRYWEGLPPGPKVLVESQFHSAQSPWTDECAFDLIEAFGRLEPVFVFTAREEPSFLARFRDAWPKTVWCREAFRLNAELYNLCDVFVGVSSGISALSHSDHCRRNVPHVELSRGESWGAAGLSHPEELFVCYTRWRYREALATVASRLCATPDLPDFAPRFPRATGRVPCPVCGCEDARPARQGELEFAQCLWCLLVHSKRCEDVNGPVEMLSSEARAGRRAAMLRSLDGLPAGASVLDIAAGESELPEIARARSMLGTSVTPAEFVAGVQPESSLDLVFASHVLQRVDYPIEFLERVEHVLRPGGILCCTFPNWSSLTSAVLMDGWPGLGRGRSRCHFTLPMLRAHFTQAGFVLERCWTDAGEGGPEPSLAALARLAPDTTASSLPLLLEAVHQNCGGEEIHVVARKRGRSKGRVAR